MKHTEAIHLDGHTTYIGQEHIENALSKPVGKSFFANLDMSSWALITERDVFISNRKDLDNCGYTVPAENTATFSIRLTVEKNNGRGFSELIVQCGDFQIVATAGTFGNHDVVCGGHLGLSVSVNIGSDFNQCFTLSQQEEHSVQYRHSKDYKKEGAKLSIVRTGIV